MTLSKRTFSLLSAAILFSLIVAPANAQALANKDPDNRRVSYVGVMPDGKTYDFIVNVDPSPASTAIYSKAEEDLLKKDFPTTDGWTFTNSTGELPGSLDVIYYDAGLAEQVGDDLEWDINNHFQVDYFGAPSLNPGWVLHWVQFVYTNYPIGDTSPYIDPTTWKGAKNWEDGLPFYWTKDENKSNTNAAPGVKLRFTDRPARPFEEVVKSFGRKVFWEAHLYLAMWDQSKSVTIDYKGIKWGFKITALETIKAIPAGVKKYTHGGVAGDKYDWDPGERLNDTSVGGYVVLADKPALLAPYFGFVGLTSAILVATFAGVVWAKRAARRKEKQ